MAEGGGKGQRNGGARWSLATALRIACGVFALKACTLAVLYVSYRQVGVREGYEPFLFLKEGQTRPQRLAELDASFVERLAPYDGQYYLDIAWRGYRRFDKEDPNARWGPPGNYAFFPLLPALIALARPLGPQGAIAALAILNVLLSGLAAAGVYRLAQRVGAPPWPTVLFLLAFPTAVFQGALYTESVFLFLSVGAALATLDASRSSSWRGVVFGYLAGLARPQGILISTLWAGHLFRRRWRGGASMPLVAAVAPLAGLATFSIVLAVAVGAPLGFLGIQRHWARDFSWSNLLGELTAPAGYKGPPFDLLALLFGIGLIPFLWRRLPPALALYGTLGVVLPLATGTALSFGRFISVSFPHFLCLAKLFERWPIARAVLLASFVVLQCLVAKGLMGWYFVG